MVGSDRELEPALARWRRGIAPAFGAKAFTRIVCGDGPRSVFVLPDGVQGFIGARSTVVKTVNKPGAIRDDVESVLTEWWREMLGVEHIGLDQDFFELGGQSLLVVRLFSKIKKKFAVDLGLSTFFEARTVRKLGQVIGKFATNGDFKPERSQVIVPVQPKGTRPPLYVMSGLDGHVLAFHRLANYLGEDQPIYGLVPRGKNQKEAFHLRVEDMAAYYVDAIRQVQLEGPYRLAGYSFGGVVAFEVARQLTAQGAVVSFLGLLDTIELRIHGSSSEVARNAPQARELQSDAQIRSSRSRSVPTVSEVLEKKNIESDLEVRECAWPSNSAI